jgi:RNA polymerase sigma-70 factor, ECF subfamily
MERIQDDGMEHAADPDLVRDARRGDEAAFTALLRPLLERAYRLATGMLQDRQLAEDAVQEAAVKAWRKIHQLREGTEMRPWFLGIVANECRTTRRGRWWGVLKIDAERRGAEAPDDAAVRGVDLRNALKRLRPEQRLVVVLYFYLDLPLEEIANIAGASFAAVRGRLYRGIRELRADFPTTEVQA